MELFGRELSLEQMVGLVECNATPDEDLVHRAALEIIAALRESRRMERRRKSVCGAIAFTFFFLLMGSVGALERGNVTLTQGTVQMLLFIGAAALFTWLAGGFDDEE